MNGEGVGRGQEAVVRVWLYARSALDNRVALAGRLDVLAAIVATHGMAEAGRSFDTGSGFGHGRAWAGWHRAVAAVSTDDIAGICIAELHELGRDPAAALDRLAALHRAGGRLWHVQGSAEPQEVRFQPADLWHRFASGYGPRGGSARTA